jgi:hypothetical protein
MVSATVSHTEIEDKVRQLSQEEKEMFIYMAKHHPQKPISEFEGKFYHLNFDWRSHRNEKGFANPYVLIEILDGQGEDGISFMAQYIRSVIGKYDKKLLDAAFGRFVSQDRKS